ncbi:MAG: hypothetical protein DRH17_05930 [Deltaproteobacteria bacterium]|nr:MAG: hypothetical protein DRH17_05930 [Deltaproteobacteria bacterium]
MLRWLGKIIGRSRSETKIGHQRDPGNSSLDRYLRRLLEVQKELGEIGNFLKESASHIKPQAPEKDFMKQIAEEVNKQMIPGFRAYYLAQEGMALLKLIAITIAVFKSNTAAENTEQRQNLEVLSKYIDEAELLLRQTLDSMEPYKTLDSNKIVEAIAARMAERKKTQ